MAKVFSFIVSLLILAACSGLKTMEEKNDAGILTKRYTINKKTQQKEGNYMEYDNEGKLIEEAIFEADILNGTRKLFYESGDIQYVETYVNGKYHGLFQAFHANGQVQLEGKYEDNQMQGEWVGYYDNGQVKERVQFKDNNENGAFIEYYETGKLKAKGTYLDGDNEDGELLMYDEHGELQRKMDCDRGRCSTIWKREEGE